MVLNNTVTQMEFPSANILRNTTNCSPEGDSETYKKWNASARVSPLSKTDMDVN